MVIDCGCLWSVRGVRLWSAGDWLRSVGIAGGRLWLAVAFRISGGLLLVVGCGRW